MNLTSITTTASGKPLSKSHTKLLAKLASLGVRSYPSPAVRQNPYSGATVELEPLAVTLHDFIIHSYWGGMVGSAFPLSVWNRARYMFLHYWPEEYYSLID